MLHIYTTMIEAKRMLRPVLVAIERHDADLGRQLRRAASSVALNIGERSGSTGGTRTARYRTALGSARETSACLDVAEALGYLGGVDEVLRGKLALVVSGLLRLTT
jgi:four helix bundle protein